MRLKIDLDEEATNRLIKESIAECRPVPLQAQVIIERALGLRSPDSSRETVPTCTRPGDDAIEV